MCGLLSDRFCPINNQGDILDIHSLSHASDGFDLFPSGIKACAVSLWKSKGEGEQRKSTSSSNVDDALRGGDDVLFDEVEKCEGIEDIAIPTGILCSKS